MAIETVRSAPNGSVLGLAEALRQFESAAADGMPGDLDLREWLDRESVLLTALAAATPTDRDELLVKATVALRRLLPLLDQDRSEEVELARSVLTDLQADAAKPSGGVPRWSMFDQPRLDGAALPPPSPG